jgi:glycerate 2-kinase
MSNSSENKLRRDALRIWQAGVDAVRSDLLVRQTLRLESDCLLIGEERIPLKAINRIAVVGAGKAGAGMAAAVEQVLGPSLMEEKKLAGWVNVPADCLRPMQRIVLHPARPAGVNEPTADGVAGSRRILQLVESLGPDDLCLCLISGGGSALMPAPAEGIALEDKLKITRHLSSAGANIEQLNSVRKQISRIKGGGLARSCRAGKLFSLIISDVLGDPLDVIASGPTVPDSSTPQAALEVLDRFVPKGDVAFSNIRDYLKRKQSLSPQPSSCRAINLIIGNNATAVDAAGMEAERLGYSHAMIGAQKSEGPAEDVGRHLADMAVRMRNGSGPNCLISGGEPVVTLVDASRRGLGGRNQQLVLAALERLAGARATGIALLSGGTDGEDGPTDAAGALLDEAVIAAAAKAGLDPADYLARNDAYHFFEPLDALIKTGPTHTNVCDIRVVVVGV